MSKAQAQIPHELEHELFSKLPEISELSCELKFSSELLYCFDLHKTFPRALIHADFPIFQLTRLLLLHRISPPINPKAKALLIDDRFFEPLNGYMILAFVLLWI